MVEELYGDSKDKKWKDGEVARLKAEQGIMEYDIGKAFDRVEHEIMASMVRNMKRHRLEEITEGKEWTMWQAEQLKALERFKRENQKKYRGTFKDINDSIRTIILQAKTEGSMGQERYILENTKKGVMPKGLKKSTSTMGEFF